MGKRNDFMLFAHGKKKAMTFSYDDGVVQDRRLVELFNRYGVKGTFNLNSGVLGFQGTAVISGRKTDISKVEAGEVAQLYAGHEVAGHGLWHSFLQNVGTPMAMHELIEDRRALEKLTGKLVRFFAYPFGAYGEDVKELLRLCGYAGARTVASTHCFAIPEDLLEWTPTCHHKDRQLMPLAEQFCTGTAFGSSLFYLWGHAYEFDADDNWQVIEDFLKYVCQFRDTIWFASNIEIADYIAAFQKRIYSADGSVVYNPTCTDIWLQVGAEVYQIPAGETACIEEPGV